MSEKQRHLGKEICRLSDAVATGAQAFPLPRLYRLLDAQLARMHRESDGSTDHKICAVEWRLARVIHDMRHGLAPNPACDPDALDLATANDNNHNNHNDDGKNEHHHHHHDVDSSGLGKDANDIPHGTGLRTALEHARRAVALRKDSLPANLWRGVISWTLSKVDKSGVSPGTHPNRAGHGGSQSDDLRQNHGPVPVFDTPVESESERLALKVEAGKSFRACLRINPSNAAAHSLYGRWCLESSNRSWLGRLFEGLFYGEAPESSVDEALKHLREADRLAGPGFSIENTLALGIALLENGDADEARDVLNQVLSWRGTSPMHAAAKAEATGILERM